MKIFKIQILCHMITFGVVGAYGSAVAAQDIPSAYSSTPRSSENTLAPRMTARVALVEPDVAAEVDQDREPATNSQLLVEQLEIEHGPFDYRLSEPLQAAGKALEDQGDVVQAMRLYERALQVTRINSGLYSEDQISIVEKLIDCNVSLGNWDVVDSHFRHLHLLYNRVYKDNQQALNRGLEEISDWHVLAINNGLGTDRIEHLREANKLFKRRLSLLEGVVASDDPVVQALHYNIAVTRHYLRVATSDNNQTIFNLFDDPYQGRLAGLD